ncbi:MAG TPA: hypothetical protein VGK74_26895 [Symbiobacteriaceae bacterium]|jgi:adenylate kinase
MTTVLVTGVSGLGRSKFFDAELKGEIRYYDLGEHMCRIAEERGLPYTESNILRAPVPALTGLRAAALEVLVHQAQKGDQSKPLVISANALFLLKDRVMEGLTTADLNAVEPDVIITLIDSPQNIHERLKSHTGEYFHLTIESIVRWQEFEVFFTNHLAKDRKATHFVVPVTQPETFLALVRREQKPIVYASYPMTHLPPEQKPLREAFVAKLKEKCTVFDPAAIESGLMSDAYFEPADHRAIRDHTIVRDLDWFIGINAQAVVAYFPSLVFSSGMNDELRYAYENGRPTYMVTEEMAKGTVPRLSPFTTYKSKMFWSSADFFEFLDKPPKLQHAFLLMQDEMINLLARLRDTGKDFSAADFWVTCQASLRNSMPDAAIAAMRADLTRQADQMYERWSGVRASVQEMRKEREPNGHAPQPAGRGAEAP